MPRSGIKITVVGGGGGAESKFGVQLTPKLNKIQFLKNLQFFAAH